MAQAALTCPPDVAGTEVTATTRQKPVAHSYELGRSPQGPTLSEWRVLKAGRGARVGKRIHSITLGVSETMQPATRDAPKAKTTSGISEMVAMKSR